jgi:hypothetical protein
MSNLAAAFRRVLLESPAAIEKLPHEEAHHLDRLFESNSLESALYSRARSLGETARLGPERESAWRIAFLLATARAGAYGEALEETRELAERLDVPARLLPAAQLAFFVHENPESRPLASLDVQVPRDRADDFRRALKGKRFFETDDLLDIDYRRHHFLRPLERDGVVVKVHVRTTPLLEEAPWDAFSEEASGLQRLDAESAALCIACDIWSRGFAHSLASFRDLRTVLQALQPSSPRLRELSVAADIVLEAGVVLRSLESLLGPCVDPRLLADLEATASLPERAARRLLRLGGALALQHRPSARWINRCRELQAQATGSRLTVAAAAG